MNWTQENTDPQALGKEFIIFNSEFDQKVSTLVVQLDKRRSTKRKMALIRTYKHLNCVKFNRITHYEEDCWERKPDNAPKAIGNKICTKKKLRTT